MRELLKEVQGLLELEKQRLEFLLDELLPLIDAELAKPEELAKLNQMTTQENTDTELAEFLGLTYD